jgi:DNA-binding beta-propeller fold protein YncE
VPDNKIYVIDLTVSPPVQIGTIEAGKQPSEMAINRAGTRRQYRGRPGWSVRHRIDLEASPPRVVDQVVVGDGPEGLAMSPARGYAASLLLNGTGATPKSAFYRHEKSYVALLKIDGKTVQKVAQADVGDLAEGIAFSPDGHYLYVGNFVESDIDILRNDGDTLTKVASLALPGHPASMRGSTP